MKQAWGQAQIKLIWLEMQSERCLKLFDSVNDIDQASMPWVQPGEGEGEKPCKGQEGVTKEETPGVAKEHNSPREAEVLKHQQLPKPVNHTHRSTPDQGGSVEAGLHTQGGPVEPLQVPGQEAELMVHQYPLTKDMKTNCKGTGLQGGNIHLGKKGEKQGTVQNYLINANSYVSVKFKKSPNFKFVKAVASLKSKLNDILSDWMHAQCTSLDPSVDPSL